eukprot:TRINITY_DN2421_c1_g1_i1.p1 TRINITY_DN2421_c1_g1~~TRINITY_DN2421_c1_g1_i1.p1  ORF type:complete len:176 (-),score=56.99 TRINITY_DN2421_c1_g1_i1:98-625(-)
MTFKYAIDTFQYCGWAIGSNQTYDHFKALIQREEDWRCRIAMAPGFSFYLPFNIPVWGIVERDHIHIDNHLNFVFHADQGKIIGVAAYPVRDNFQFTKVGSIITMHGPVKWFLKGTFHDITPHSHYEPLPWLWPIIAVWSLMSSFLTALALSCCYSCYIRPKMMKELLKLKKKNN